MEFEVSFKDAKEILKYYYGKMYPNHEVADINYYYSKAKRYALTGIDSDNSPIIVYVICAEIKLIKRVGDKILRMSVTKDNDTLHDDLKKALSEAYETEISCIWMPEPYELEDISKKRMVAYPKNHKLFKKEW
jgi:hypothetical protein